MAYELADGRSMLIEHRRMKDGSNVSTWTDVTSIRAAEAERRALEAQLHHAQKLDALGQLAGGIAHDLNNALVPVLALTKMVQADLPITGGGRIARMRRPIAGLRGQEAMTFQPG